MILVDSSVWVDYFNASLNPESELLDELLEKEIVLVGDIILLEVLQGIRSDERFERINKSLAYFQQVNLMDTTIAVQAAKFYRDLRKKGITIRKMNDCIIATWCILNQVPLLHRDHDFDPFGEYFGLKIRMSNI